MSKKEHLNPEFVKYLTQHYSNNSNEELAAHLTIIANAANPSDVEIKISTRTVQHYANVLHLHKSHTYNIIKSKCNKLGSIMADYDGEVSFYSGSPVYEIRSINKNRPKAIVCANRRQIKSIKNAVHRHNAKYCHNGDIHIKILYDTEGLTVILVPETISLPDSCRSHISPAEDLCDPP